MISSTPTIKVLSKLDWPGKLKSSLAVQCVGPSFLLYKSRRELRTCNFLNVSSDKKNDITTIDSNHIVNDKVKHSIDLNTLSTKQLDKLTYYEILGGLELHSTPEQIKRAFHKVNNHFSLLRFIDFSFCASDSQDDECLTIKNTFYQL